MNDLGAFGADAFVGRDSELALLRAAAEQACAGHGRFVLIAGDPGMGKTRTAQEIATHSRERGMRVLWGRCFEGDGAPAFWPWVQIIRAVTHEWPTDILRAKLGVGAPDIAQIVPEIRERLPDVPHAAGLDSEQARVRLFDSVATLLRTVAADTPLVVIVDDLQGADRSSLLLLRAVLAQTEEAPLLVVGACRAAALGEGHAAAVILNELRNLHGAESLSLAGLSETEVARFIEVNTGTAPQPALTAALHERAEGSPLFLKEFVHLLLERGGESLPHGATVEVQVAVPATVTAVIQHRLAAVSPACAEVLSAAAVIGREFRIDVLEQIVGAVSAAFDEALAAGILTNVAHAERSCRFSHALIRETLYETLPPMRRTDLHRRVGEAIERLPNLQEHFAELAYHMSEAGGDQYDKAAAYAQHAGERALASLAYEEAIRLFDVGLRALQQSPGAPSHPPANTELRQRCELLLGSARARKLAGDTGTAKALFLQAADVARTSCAPDLFARAALGAGWRESSENADPAYAALLTEALDTLGEQDSALRAELLGRLGNELHRGKGTHNEGASMGREAVSVARRVADPMTLAQALHQWYLNDYHPDNLVERLAATNEIVRLGEEHGDRSTVLDGLRLRVPTWMEYGDLVRADHDIETYATLAEELRQPRWLWWTPMFRCARAFLEGRFDDAERHGQEAVAVGQQAQEPEPMQLFFLLIFMVRGMQGRLGELPLLESASKDMRKQHSWNSGWRVGPAYAYLLLGREAEARGHFDKVAANDFTDLTRDTNWLVTMSFLARICAGLGDSRRAQLLYSALLPYKERNLTQTTAFSSEGSASRYLGLLAATMQRWDEAALHFEDAITMNTRLNARAFLALTQQEYAAALVARGLPLDRPKELDLLTAAHDTAVELGLRPLVEKVEALRDGLQAPGARGLRSDATRASVPVGEPQSSPPPRPRPVIPTPRVFVGRERELRVLRAGVENALAGRGRLLLLVGEPGIGKTRTCEELARSAADRGAQVFWGRCFEGDGAPPFWPWVQIIRACTRTLEPEVLQRLLGVGGPVIAQMVPEIREQLPELTPATGLDTPQARFQLFDGICSFLGSVARRAPLVIILDDLHGADEPSLRLLQFVAREMRDMPLLVVGAHRDVALGRGDPLSATVAELLRETAMERLSLSGLSESEVAHFVELTASVKPSPAVVAALHKSTEGNPLFITEFVRALLAEGDQSAIGDPHPAIAVPIPDSVKAAIDRRLAPLSSACAEVLSVAAVIGREFRLDVLEAALVGAQDAAVLQRPTDRRPAAGDLLAEAVVARVLAPVPETRGSYRFAHALIRETLYEELSPARRAQLQQQVGEALERLPDAEEHLAELAHHFLAAGRHGDSAKAIAYAWRAGDRAMALLAYEEAARLFQMGLDVLAETHSDHGRCELLLGLAEAQRKAGQVEQSKRTVLRAADVARASGDRDQFGRAALGFGTEFTWGDSPAPDDGLVSLLEEALTAWADQDSPLHVRLLGRLCIALHFADAEARRTQLISRAVAMARRVGDEAALAFALYSKHVCWDPAAVEDRLAVAAELVALAKRVGDAAMEFQGCFFRLHDALELGDRAAVEAGIRECRRLAELLRQPLYRWQAATLQVVLPICEGGFSDVERLAQQAFEIRQPLGQLEPFAFALQMLTVRSAQGRLAEVEPVFEDAATRYPNLPALTCLLGYICGELNRTEDARRHFEHFAMNGFANLPYDVNWLPGLTELSEVCVVLKDVDRAATLYRLLVPCRQQAVVIGGMLMWCGPVSHYLGMLATTLGWWEDATQQFEAALVMSATMRAHPWVARTQYAYAEMHVARNEPGDRDKAAWLLEQALATARELGMQGLEEKVSRLLSVASVSNESPRPPAIRAPQRPAEDEQSESSVFRREGDYWTLRQNGTVLRLKDSKGLQYIQHLLRHPGQEFHVLDLVMQVSGPGDDAGTLGAGRQGSEGQKEAASLRDGGSAILDATAKAAYRQRLRELRDELAEAEQFNDMGRRDRLRTEMDMLGEELTKAMGLGGRDRRTAHHAERARSAVTHRIRTSLRKIREGNPGLAAYLSRAIITGYLCMYLPDSETAISWLF